MTLATFLILAVIVVAAAYVLGTALRRREGATPARPAAAPTRLFVSQTDREEQAVVNWLLTQAFEQTGVKVADDKVAYGRVVEATRLALKDLRSRPVVTISLPFLTADAAGPKHFEIRLTRDVIKELVRY